MKCPDCDAEYQECSVGPPCRCRHKVDDCVRNLRAQRDRLVDAVRWVLRSQSVRMPPTDEAADASWIVDRSNEAAVRPWDGLSEAIVALVEAEKP